MNSTTILRRALAIRTLAARPPAPSSSQLLCARAYATPSGQEPDPQLNGYPELPFVSRQHLPPTGWQDQLERRNFGDTLHEQAEVLSMWGPDIPPAGLTVQSARLQLILAAIGFVGVGFFINNVLKPDPPAVRREYPFSGLVTELGGMEENKARSESLTEED